MQNRKPGTFGIGNTAKKGKASPGSGRTPDWLRAKCQALIDKNKLIEFLADVGSGEYMENIFDGSTKTGLMRSADAKDRIRAIEILLDRGFGKATQPLEHSGNVGSRLIFIHPAGDQCPPL